MPLGYLLLNLAGEDTDLPVTVLRYGEYPFINVLMFLLGSNNKEIANMHKDASSALTEMNLWKEVTDRRGNPAYILNQTFAENLKVAMFGG